MKADECTMATDLDEIMDNSTSCALLDENLVESATPSTIESSVDLLQSDKHISIQERLNMCFKPTYKLRKLKNKGAILVLVFNFLVTSVFYYISLKSIAPEQYCTLCFKLIEVPIGLVLPFAGWLADIYFRRYKVLVFSIVIMWISALLLTIIFMVERFVLFTNYIQIVLLASLGIGYGCFQANVIQFGIDQLTDASTDEIVSFINWYFWSYSSSGTFVNLVSVCIGPRENFTIPLLLCVSLSIIAGLIFWCNGILVKEPVTLNPFKLIYRVLKYAIKHTHPEQRSAFTYCEDELPSRLDFGKSKYGGPFTTEQVEDVKTFFGGLGLVLIVSAVFGMTDEKGFQKALLDVAMEGKKTDVCPLTFVFTDIYHITVMVMIPLNEIIIFPIFHRCTPKITRRWKTIIGIILQLGRYIILISLVSVARHDMNIPAYTNTTLRCIFEDNPLNATISLEAADYRLYSIPEFISALSYIMIVVGAIEFLCAQIPYSMKGLIVGIFYGSMVLSVVLNRAISHMFVLKSSTWEGRALFSCEFWYLQTKLIFLFIAVISSLLAAVYYKKRKRDDVLPNEQIFAERYYSKKLQCA